MRKGEWSSEPDSPPREWKVRGHGYKGQLLTLC